MTTHTLNHRRSVLQRFIQSGRWFGQLILLTVLTSLPAQAVEKITYFDTDVLGSPVIATDEQGNLLWRQTYQPYGKRHGAPPSAADYPVQFTGKPEDPETGLVYLNARYYHPAIGRFYAIDPIGFVEGNVHSFNRYAYANNNPYRFVDPTGKAGELVLEYFGSFVATDAGFPDPSDGAWPKWAGYAVIGGVLAGIVYATSDDEKKEPPPKSSDENEETQWVGDEDQRLKDFPKGYMPGDKGAIEWGRRNKIPRKKAREAFHHGVKQADGMSQATDGYGVNPDTGDVIDPTGTSVGNLEDALSDISGWNQR